MSKLRLIALAALAVMAIRPAFAQGYLSVYEDLPLAPGIHEVPASGVSFDSPGGRIAEAYAKGPVKAAEVFQFYATALPQLGWKRESDQLYRREAEVLRLEASPAKGDVVVHFQISPE
jgi:hypothetical protein